MLKLKFEAEQDQITTSPSKKRRQTLLMHIELNEAASNKKHKTLISNSPELTKSGNSLNNSGDNEDSFSFSPRVSSSSCCSSNGSNNNNNKRITSINLADLQDEVETSGYSSCREREITLSSQETEEVASTESMEENSHRRSSSTTVSSTGRRRVMPSESELEDFFVQAEKNIQKQFTDKYNYDIMKDEPLKGRYEWVRLKP